MGYRLWILKFNTIMTQIRPLYSSAL